MTTPILLHLRLFGPTLALLVGAHLNQSLLAAEPFSEGNATTLLHAAIETPQCRFPNNGTVDLLISTNTFSRHDQKPNPIRQCDGYRIRLTFDDNWQLARQQIDRLWSGNGRFGHPMIFGNEADIFLHARDDGTLIRFLLNGPEKYASQEFDETTRKWGPEIPARTITNRLEYCNLRTDGNRWECFERGKPPSSVIIYDRDRLQAINDEWLERTLMVNLKLATFSIGNGIRVSNEKNFVVREQSKKDRQEFYLYAFGVEGETKYLAPSNTYVRGVSEARDGRAAILFTLHPDIVYAQEIDRQAGNRIFDLKELKQARSKWLCESGYDMSYHADNHTVVGVDADSDVVPANPKVEFEAKARIVRWSLETGELADNVVPFGDYLHVIDGHVVPKSP